MAKNKTKNQPAHKSFHFDASILISALALFFSIVVGLFTVWNELHKETTTTRQNLTNNLEQITDIDREATEFSALPLTNEQKDFASYSFANRKVLLLRQAEELYKKLRKKTTAEDAGLISVAYSGIGESEKAETYMRAYLEKATKGLMRAYAFRSLAFLAIARGNDSDANMFFQKASVEIGKPENLMEQNFIMWIDMYKYQHSVMRNDYSSAANHLKKLAIKAQNLACTTGRAQWLKRIYNIVRSFNQYLNIDAPSLAKANKANCMYDPPLPNSTISAKGLARYTGAYTFQNHRLRVFMWDDNTLAVALLGKPLHILKTKKDNGYFEILGLSGYKVIFHPGSTDNISKLEFIQPNGRYMWNRSI